MKTYSDLGQYNSSNEMSSILYKWAEYYIAQFFKEHKIRSKEEITLMIYKIAEILDQPPGKIRIIYERTRTKGYGYTDNPRRL